MDEQLLFRSLKGRTSAAEEAAVAAWRRASPANERTYRELGEILAASRGATNGAAGSEARSPAGPPSPFKLIHMAETRRSAGAGEGRSGAAFRSRWKRWTGGFAAAAAVVVLVIGLGDVGRLVWAGGGSEADEFVTGAAETATLMLRDGTVVRLAPRSRLRLAGGSRVREVSLRGRAFFAVAKDPNRPFRIETAAGRVEVLGTRFDLQTDEDDLQLVVVEGRVALAGRGGTTEVPAGEMRRVVAGTTLPAVKLPDAISEVDWVGNFLAFQETPLRDAAREIERLYGVRIEITDSSLAKQTITTWFADQPLEQVMTIFCLVAEARCQTHNGLIIVEPLRGR